MSIYTDITRKIISELENGTVPWRKPWKTVLPMNLATGMCYRGVNIVVLRLAGYGSPWWATFRQVNKLGGHIRKGEKGTMVVYTNWLTVEDEKHGKDKEIPFLRAYKVFNLEQTEGISPPEEEVSTLTPINRCEEIVNNMPGPPLIKLNGGNRAFYRPSTDSIHMPVLNVFDTAERYYGTLFHELTHSTGHPARLNRKGVIEAARFGSDNYSQEELVAELGASFLCGMTGIFDETINHSVSYIDNWLKVLKADSRILVVSAAQAQRAVDHIVGSQPLPQLNNNRHHRGACSPCCVAGEEATLG